MSISKGPRESNGVYGRPASLGIIGMLDTREGMHLIHIFEQREDLYVCTVRYGILKLGRQQGLRGGSLEVDHS